MTNRGFFGIGIQLPKTEVNVGTLWRSAHILGASFLFTIGRRYKRQASDTMASWRHIPLYYYDDFECFYNAMPYDCQLVGVELHNKSVPVAEFKHPERCIYLLGAEDHGLSNEAINKCHHLVQLPGDYCMNVAVAGSIIMYDRLESPHCANHFNKNTSEVCQ
jgi:tRNA G18 (ribose-2'-O)-methylase SpoU